MRRVCVLVLVALACVLAAGEPEASAATPPTAGQLTVKVVGATGVKGNDGLFGLGGKLDTYIKVRVAGDERKTATAESTESPVWNEEFTWEGVPDAETVNVELWDDDTLSRDDLVGAAVLSLKDVRDGEAADRTLAMVDSDGEAHGQVTLHVTWTTTAESFPPSDPTDFLHNMHVPAAQHDAVRKVMEEDMYSTVKCHACRGIVSELRGKLEALVGADLDVERLTADGATVVETFCHLYQPPPFSTTCAAVNENKGKLFEALAQKKSALDTCAEMNLCAPARAADEDKKNADARAEKLRVEKALQLRGADLIEHVEAVVINVRGSRFVYESGELTDLGKKLLQDIAPVLKEGSNSLLDLEIVGHYDTHNGQSFAQRIGTVRAHAVRRALVAEGIKESRIVACESAGMESALLPNDDAASRATNRRVEIRVLMVKRQPARLETDPATSTQADVPALPRPVDKLPESEKKLDEALSALGEETAAKIFNEVKCPACKTIVALFYNRLEERLSHRAISDSNEDKVRDNIEQAVQMVRREACAFAPLDVTVHAMFEDDMAVELMESKTPVVDTCIHTSFCAADHHSPGQRSMTAAWEKKASEIGAVKPFPEEEEN